MSKKRKKNSNKPWYKRIVGGLKNKLNKLKKRRDNYLERRPHRSFRRTRRRDYKRSLKLPGYWSLTVQVLTIINKNKKLLIGLALLYGLLTILLSSMMSQDAYDQIKGVADSASENGLYGAFAVNISLFWGVFTSQLSGASISEVGSSQQIFSVLLGLYAWLAVVWLLRSIMSGKKPRLRDGLYGSGGPVLALVVLLCILAIQMIPAAIALIAYEAADTSGLLDQTAILMLFGGGAILLGVLSLYWMTSTVIAMVVATLPGMYPMQAIKIAGDLAIGRRVRILLRLLWSVVLLFIFWLVILLPVILLDGALKSAIPDLSWLPLVPITAIILMAWSVVFEAAYVYVFYRRIIDDDSAPA